MTKASTTARPLTVSGYFKKMRGELKQGPGHFQAPSYIACAVFVRGGSLRQPTSV
jgi:hypothetical protein